MNKETVIQREIMIALSKEGCKVFRNETGGFWTGKVIHKDGRTVTLANAQMMQCGLCVGSSDIIGITPNGKFIAIEVKTETGRVTKEQITFINNILSSGGIAGIARSVADALELLSRHQ